MVPRNLLFTICALLLVPTFGCKAPANSTSTGPIKVMTDSRWPSSVPRRVAVLPLDGNSKLTRQTTDMVATELLKAGFEVIERGQLDSVTNELKISNSGLVDDTTRTQLGAILGVEAIFTGSITGRENWLTFKTHLSLKLIDVKTGKVLWAAETSDPRRFGHLNKMSASHDHTVREAIQLMKKDLNL